MPAPYLIPSPPPTLAELDEYERIYNEIKLDAQRMRVEMWAEEAKAKGLPKDEYIEREREFAAYIAEHYKGNEEEQRQDAEARSRWEYRASAYIWSRLGRPPVQLQKKAEEQVEVEETREERAGLDAE